MQTIMLYLVEASKTKIAVISQPGYILAYFLLIQRMLFITETSRKWQWSRWLTKSVLNCFSRSHKLYCKRITGTFHHRMYHLQRISSVACLRNENPIKYQYIFTLYISFWISIFCVFSLVSFVLPLERNHKCKSRN